MQRTTTLNRILAAVCALWLLATAQLSGQGITTAAISGTVVDGAGKPVSGATITVVHGPSGTRATTVTRANGQYNLSGLRVGGPFSISASAPGLTLPAQNDVYLSLDQVQSIDFQPASDVVKLEAFQVTGSSDAFGAGRMGSGSRYSERDINNVATVRNNVQDVARLDSRINLTSLDQGGQMSAQGQNFRFNSFLIDGVEANDPFGLNGNGFSSLRSPIPLDAVEALSAEISPYDVRRSGFTGVLINVVTKSGTNEFKGSARYEFSNDDFRAPNPNPASSAYNKSEYFEERTYNFSFGGPIIPNKLFFYFNYDDFRRETSAPGTSFTYTDPSQIEAIVARAKALGYDPGTLSSSAISISTQKTYVGKIDWNIVDGQRLSLSYRKNEGTTPSFPGYTSTFGQSFSNYWFDTPRTTESYTAQLNSQWTPDFSTEAAASYSEYDGSPKNKGTPFPSVSILGLNGIRGDSGATINTGSVLLGTEASRQMNVLKTKDKLGKLTGTYAIGNHTLTAGGEVQVLDYYNAFLQNAYGTYSFSNVAAWQAGTPSNYTSSRANTGYTLADGIANWTYNAYGVYLQDVWALSSSFKLTSGLRFDYPYISEKPPLNAAFEQAFGLRNNTNNSGNATLAPRIGFNWQLPTERKTEVRGGVGLFQGRNPAVWLSNAYSNAGQIGTVTATGTSAPAFSANVNNQPTPTGTSPIPNINVTDPKFRQPVVWKGNLAIDHRLPFWDLDFTAEVSGTKTERALAIKFLNYQVATTGPTTMPDGRVRYAGNITPAYGSFASTTTTGRRRVSSYADVYYLTNTNQGTSHDVTLSLNKRLKNKWAAGVSWTAGRATEVSPMTSSTAGSLYLFRAAYNPNDNVASKSNTNVDQKIVASLTREFEFIKRFPTTIGLAYIGQTGHNYSWVFKGDANGDGFQDNDLFYMPTGIDDPKVRWADTAERDAFFAFAAANKLTKYAGKVIPRNAVNSPWVNTVDLTLTQEIPVWRKVKTQLYVNVINFANLIDDSWGIQEEVPFGYRRRAAGTTYDATNNQYVYVFNSSTYDTVPVTADETQVSRWQVKFGIKVDF